MSSCQTCGASPVEGLLDFGPQPICNRFLPSPEGPPEFLHPLKLGQCTVCGLVQSVDPVPAAELMPSYEWITYNEPEGHLDTLADALAALPGMGPEAVVYGVSFKDDSTLRRLRERGVSRTHRFDVVKDFGVPAAWAGVESIQDRLRPDLAEGLVERYGPADLVVVRHILEHAYDMPGFMAALLRLLKPGGRIMLEVPDCTRVLDTLDYTTVWEEHIAYFTPPTFQAALRAFGVRTVYYRCFPYPFENSMVAVVEAGVAEDARAGELESERARGRRFAEAFPRVRERTRAVLKEAREKEGPIALFGAGHLACVYLSFFDLSRLVDFVVDDHPGKKGLFMPGSRLPILPSAALREKGIKLCLTSLSPESERKVMEKQQAYLRGGGRFASIIPASPLALLQPEA